MVPQRKQGNGQNAGQQHSGGARGHRRIDFSAVGDSIRLSGASDVKPDDVADLVTEEGAAMPHLYLLGSLSRRITVCRPRDRLWELEGRTLDRAWRALAAGDPVTVSDRLGRLIGPRMRKQRHCCETLLPPFRNGRPYGSRRRQRGSGAPSAVPCSSIRAWTQLCNPDGDRVRVLDLGESSMSAGRADPGSSWHPTSPAGTCCHLPPHSGVPLTVVYRRQRNPLIEALMSDWRATLGCGFLAVEEAWRGMLRELRQGRSVGLLMDQRYDRGVAVPFFGVPAPTTLVPARLALRLCVPLIPARIERRSGARFVITVHRPVEPRWLDQEEAAMGMTARVNQLFQRWIAAAPDQWFCAKRRWPRPPTLDAEQTRHPSA